MTTAGIVGVVLAAGASRRLGTAKQLLADETGCPMVARTARQLAEAGCSPVVVVTGASHDDVAAALAGHPVEIIRNPGWIEGIGSSISCGMKWIASNPTAQRSAAVLVSACDMPSVTAEHFRAMIGTSTGLYVRVASAYELSPNGTVLGIPALFPKSDWGALRSLSGDRGARDLFRLPGTLSVFLRNGNFDLDTSSDVIRWRAERSPPTPSPRLMASSIAQSVLADLDHEVANTRKMLALVPADHLDFSPHTKSWPLQKLANHLTDFPTWGVITLKQDVLDMAVPFPTPPPMPTTGAGFVAVFDERMTAFSAALAGASDAQMMETWTMKNGDAVIMAMPRIAVMRSMIINHMIHHRAQLTIYFRLLNVPVPGMYGPSADETT